MRFTDAAQVDHARKEYFSRWHQANKDRRNKRRMELYWKNREHEIAMAVAWQRRNRHKTKAYQKKWCSNHKPLLAERSHRYRELYGYARKTTREESARIRQYWLLIKSKSCVECHWCRKIFPISEIEMDHIIPISRGGRHVLENICPACRPCNRRKSHKLVIDYEI